MQNTFKKMSRDSHWIFVVRAVAKMNDTDENS